MDNTQLLELIRSELMEVNTGLVGEIVSYADGIASVRPVVRQLFKDGRELAYPVIYNVPVQWPRFAGGAAGFKAPVRKGDRCWLAFSQRAMDGSDDVRAFDLTDCVAQMGVYDGPRSQWEQNNDSSVMYFGAHAIQITESGEIHMYGTKILHHAPVEGDEGATYVTQVKSATVVAEGVTAATVAGSQQVSCAGVSLSSHKHSGVQSGPSTTGTPVV